MAEKKFNPKQLQKLTDPKRLEFQSPDLIWQTLHLKSPKVLVDIGAGTGFFAVPFCDKLADGIVYACDTSQVMIDWMREHIPAKYERKVIPLICEETTIPLENEIADLVYMINLHHELENPQATLGDSVRMLKKGGSLLVIDWKPEVTPAGPPLEIRVPESVIMEQFAMAGLMEIRRYDVLPYHYFIVGSK
jgi:ubiquinone/menaquinone biosynthesis C-methylase UbiE